MDGSFLNILIVYKCNLYYLRLCGAEAGLALAGAWMFRALRSTQC